MLAQTLYISNRILISEYRNMKDILIVYPHGLGDCILLTPTLREYTKERGHKLHVAILERFRSSEIFDHCPYVDKIFYTKDAWHDYPNQHIGFRSLAAEWKQKAIANNFKGLVMPMHDTPENKILLNLKALGLSTTKNPQTEIFTSEEDVTSAAQIIKDTVGDNKFGFIQTHAGLSTKDLPDQFGRNWLRENKGLEHFIEIGKEIDAFQYNINIQFEILKKSTAVCLTDSVFYHACHALNKPVDYAYFARGKQVYDRVRPLHEVQEHISYKIE